MTYKWKWQWQGTITCGRREMHHEEMPPLGLGHVAGEDDWHSFPHVQHAPSSHTPLIINPPSTPYLPDHNMLPWGKTWSCPSHPPNSRPPETWIHRWSPLKLAGIATQCGEGGGMEGDGDLWYQSRIENQCNSADSERQHIPCRYSNPDHNWMASKFWQSECSPLGWNLRKFDLDEEKTWMWHLTRNLRKPSAPAWEEKCTEIQRNTSQCWWYLLLGLNFRKIEIDLNRILTTQHPLN